MLLIKTHCGKASRTLHQGREVTGSRTVFCYNKNSLWQGRQDIALGDERLQVQTRYFAI